MMVMWEEKEITFRDLVKKLYLESNTLTPVLKKLEDKKLIERKKKTGNDKNILLSITKKGIDLKEKAKQVPKELEKCIVISEDDINTLKEMLNRIIKRFNQSDEVAIENNRNHTKDNNIEKEAKKVEKDISKENISKKTEKTNSKDNKKKVNINNSKKTVVIDPGHQAKGDSSKEPVGPGATETKAKVTTGATGNYTKQKESELVLKVSLLLEKELKNEGYNVIMTRTTNNVNISNSERAKIANEVMAEAFIRIHADSYDDSSINRNINIVSNIKKSVQWKNSRTKL